MSRFATSTSPKSRVSRYLTAARGIPLTRICLVLHDDVANGAYSGALGRMTLVLRHPVMPPDNILKT